MPLCHGKACPTASPEVLLNFTFKQEDAERGKRVNKSILLHREADGAECRCVNPVRAIHRGSNPSSQGHSCGPDRLLPLRAAAPRGPGRLPRERRQRLPCRSEHAGDPDTARDPGEGRNPSGTGRSRGRNILGWARPGREMNLRGRARAGAGPEQPPGTGLGRPQQAAGTRGGGPTRPRHEAPLGPSPGSAPHRIRAPPGGGRGAAPGTWRPPGGTGGGSARR